MQVGIDLQHIPQFEESYKRSGEEFLRKIFTEKELLSCGRAKNRDMEYLCGRFCAKEAAVKAGLLEVGKWHDIEIIGEKPEIPGASISISHSGDYCVAVVIVQNPQINTT